MKLANQTLIFSDCTTPPHPGDRQRHNNRASGHLKPLHVVGIRPNDVMVLYTRRSPTLAPGLGASIIMPSPT